MRSEFQINISTIRQSRKKIHRGIEKEPVIRQYLVLAYQIKDYLEKNPNKTARTIASWLGFTPSRVSQLLNLLFLCPAIQEEILLSDNKKLYSIPEHKVRVITKKVDWEEQWEMWITLKGQIRSSN